MTLDEAKKDWQKRAAEFVEANGCVGYMPEDDGTVDIGNGFFVTEAEAHELMVDAL